MFRVWGTTQSRATRDIDLLARAGNSVDTISAMMKDVCQQSVEPDGVVFFGDSVQGATIKEDAEYSGVRVTFVAMIQNARLPMQIDVGFGDVINRSWFAAQHKALNIAFHLEAEDSKIHRFATLPAVFEFSFADFGLSDFD